MVRAAFSFNKFNAVVGTVKWKDSPYRYSLSKFVSHEAYDEETYSNDICLVKTAEPIKIIESKTHFTVNTVCLPKSGSEIPTKGTVYGWGLLKEDGEASPDLMKLVVEKYDTEKCNEAYKEYIGNFTAQMMCYASPGKDSCKV